MSVVTEIAHIPLQASLAIEVTDGAVGKTFSRMLDLLRNAQGSLGVYWSRQVEHVDILEILIDWEDYAAFEEFPKTSAFQEFLELLPQIAAGPPTIRNARFRNGSGFSSLATSPVLEMTTTYLPLGVDAPAYEKIVDSFLPILAKNTKGLIGSASGWIIEEQESPVAGSADTKVKAFVVCLAWESIDAHVSSTRIPENKEAIAPWKAAILHAEMHHVKLQQ